MVVQHNLTAMNSNRMLGITQSSQAKSSEKLSSGYQINRAADDAAGLTISEKMRKQINGLDRASTNAQDGVSAVQTAEGALTEVHSMLQRMNELAVQAANGTNSKDDRDAIQAEVDQLLTEIDRVAETTKFNETYLLKGDDGLKDITMVGHDAGLKGVLTDGATTATFDMVIPEAGDKVNIGGKEYTIGATADEAKALYEDVAVDGTEKVTVNGKEYTVQDTTPDATAGEISKDDLDALVVAGATVEYGGKSATVITDANNDKVDDADATIITADKAKELVIAELTAANNIGATKTAATVAAGADTTVDGKDAWSFTITKGKAEVANTLTFGLHVGADADMTNKIGVDIDAMSTAGLGIEGLNVSDDSGIAATYAIDAIADAVAKVSEQRSALGAIQNRLEHTIDNLDNVVENTTAAESRIRDTDMAEEMVEYSKNNILAQAGQSMLAQANQANQGVLSLLG